MKKFVYFLVAFLAMYAAGAEEKQEAFGDLILYYNTEDAGKYIKNPKKWCLKHGLVLDGSFSSKDLNELAQLSDEKLRNETDNEEYYFELMLKTIVLKKLKTSKFTVESMEEGIFLYFLRDKKGNLYLAAPKEQD